MKTSRGKIVSKQELQNALAEHKRRGETVVLANGCFDLLHIGHLRYLEGASDEADVLVVGVNADATVRALKGEGRPVQPDADRAALVAALEVVDYVVIFDEPNVEALLESLRPDVHAKGTDYTEESVPERAVSQRLGIRTAIVGDPKGHSTRELIESIRKRPHE